MPFVGISVAINTTNLANHHSALLWVTDPILARDFGQAVGADTNVFFGLWLVPLGVLLYRSDQVPRILGVLVVAAGVAFPIACAVPSSLPAPRIDAVAPTFHSTRSPGLSFLEAV